MKREIKLSIMIAFCFLLFLLPGKDAFAGVRQVGLAKDSVTVEWILIVMCSQIIASI